MFLLRSLSISRICSLSLLPSFPVSLFSFIGFPSHPLFLLHSFGITSFPDLSIHLAFSLNPTLSLPNSITLSRLFTFLFNFSVRSSSSPFSCSLSLSKPLFSILLLSPILRKFLYLCSLSLSHYTLSPSRSSSSVRSLSPSRSLFSYPSCFASPSLVLLPLLSPNRSSSLPPPSAIFIS